MMSILKNSFRVLTIGVVFAILSVSNVFAATIDIDFESSSNPLALPGAEATNFYTSLGVRFDSRPTIERYRSPLFPSTQVLQQTSPAGRTCETLEMYFNNDMAVREVRMRVINRHLRSYRVQAFSGDFRTRDVYPITVIDTFNYHISPVGGPPFPTPPPYMDIVLRAADDEPNITRVFAHPPAGCFDFMVIDNLTIETLYDPVAIAPLPDPPPPPAVNRISVAAYEVSQGVMSHLSQRREDWLPPSQDTRLMALPRKHIPLISGRDTGVRFFLEASQRSTSRISPILRVNIAYKDGTYRREDIYGENTEGGNMIPARDTSATEQDIRRSLVLRRARMDQSLDFVIPGHALINARAMQLYLSENSLGRERRLALINMVFEGPYIMGVNFARIRGIGDAAGAGEPPPNEPWRSYLEAFLEDIYPVSDVYIRRFPIPFAVDEGFGNCNSFLTVMSAAFEGAITEAAREFPFLSANYWTNLYFVGQSPPDCSGLGFYHRPQAFVKNIFDTPQEIGHTMGLNHVTNLHSEGTGGFENWPYQHGSIGTVDEGLGYDYGVFGLVMGLNDGSAGVWGTWTMGAVPPCRGDSSEIFPNCNADSNMMHDFISYGGGGLLPIWGNLNNLSGNPINTRWTSDINYHRIARFFESCIVLDPPNRFWGPAPVQEPVTSSNPGCWNAEGGDDSDDPGDGAAARTEALIFYGYISNTGEVESFRTLRKPVLLSALSNVPGEYTLTMTDQNGLILQSIPFSLLVSPVESVEKDSQGRSFIVVAPWDPQLMKIEITDYKTPIFEKTVSLNKPFVDLLTPKPDDIWYIGQPNGQLITWLAKDNPDEDKARVFIQYSPDQGETWHPLASVNAALGELNVDITGLEETEEAQIYISITDGLNSDAFILRGIFAVRKTQ